MKIKLLSLGLTAILVAPFIATSKVGAWVSGDPHDTGCDRQATTIASVNGVGYGPWWNYKDDFKVEMRYSKNCSTNWVTATGPAGSTLYLEDTAHRRYVEYKTTANGTYHTDMWNAAIEYRACSYRGDNGQTVCTEYVP